MTLHCGTAEQPLSGPPTLHQRSALLLEAAVRLLHADGLDAPRGAPTRSSAFRPWVPSEQLLLHPAACVKVLQRSSPLLALQV